MELINILCSNVCLPRSEIERQIAMGFARVDREVRLCQTAKVHPGQLVQLGGTVRFVAENAK